MTTTNGVKAKRTREPRTPANDSRIPNQHKRPSFRVSSAQPRLTATQDIVRRARAAAAALRPGSARARESIMDVVLNAQAPNTRVYVEDLQDAIDECYRAALYVPASEVDDVLADMFVPGRYAARQAALADAVQVIPEEFTANEIYRVSAERSTVTWEPSLDSDDNASMES